MRRLDLRTVLSVDEHFAQQGFAVLPQVSGGC
jgi:predicted nucleic acid-binding protein